MWIIRSGILWLCLVGAAFAQASNSQSIPSQSSPAAGEQSHAFTGRNLSGITVTWAAGTTARYLYLFDATTLPVNGAVTSCTPNRTDGCAEWCGYLPNTTSAPNIQAVEFSVTHRFKFGIIAALSTDGGACSSFTLDTGTNWYNASPW